MPSGGEVQGHLGYMCSLIGHCWPKESNIHVHGMHAHQVWNHVDKTSEKNHSNCKVSNHSLLLMICLFIFPDEPLQPASSSNESMPSYCKNDEGDIFLTAESWKPNVCTSCICMDGVISCYSESCPPVSCERPVLRKGQCCPYCIGKQINKIICSSLLGNKNEEVYFQSGWSMVFLCVGAVCAHNWIVGKNLNVWIFSYLICTYNEVISKCKM